VTPNVVVVETEGEGEGGREVAVVMEGKSVRERKQKERKETRGFMVSRENFFQEEIKIVEEWNGCLLCE
jgi:hypothetical protein